MPTSKATPLSPLAQRVLADHRRAPGEAFYDLLSLGSFFDTARVAQLDEAYAQLESGGLVERAEGQSVSFGGNSRPMYRLTAQARGGVSHPVRRRSA